MKKVKNNPSANTKAQAVSDNSPSGSFYSMEKFLAKNSKLILGLAIAFCALFGAMLFDGRLSFATDDATYINNAWAFLHRGTYPTFQGALYPFMLALLMSIFGVKLLLFKLFSLICLLVQIWVLYKALRNRVPYLVLFAGLFTVAFNSYILAYGSATFTEAFFMLVQAVCLWAFFNLTDKLDENNSFKANLKYWLIFGFCFFLLSITKNVAIFTTGIAVLYFLVRKEWKYAGLAIVFFLLFKVPYELGARAIFGDTSSKQTEMLLRKDFNDPSQGTVDASDLADRFFENFGQYISTHTFKMLGLRGSGEPQIFTIEKMKEMREPMESSGFYSLIFVVFFVAALWFSFKYNRYIFFLVLYVSGMCFLTFVGIHTHWNQDRYMVIFLPLIVGIFIYAIYAAGKHFNIGLFVPAAVVFAIIILLTQLGPTLKEAPKHSKFMRKYLKGDEFYGYPQGIANYVKACRWAGTELEEGSIMANRPVEAMVYGKEMRFTRVPKPLPTDADSALAYLKKNNTQYLIIDEVGLGNVKGFAQVLLKKYPNIINPQPLHVEGQVEPAAVYKINH